MSSTDIKYAYKLYCIAYELQNEEPQKAVLKLRELVDEIQEDYQL